MLTASAWPSTFPSNESLADLEECNAPAVLKDIADMKELRLFREALPMLEMHGEIVWNFYYEAKEDGSMTFSTAARVKFDMSASWRDGNG